MALSGGVRVGPYEIVTRIGAGGMGEVYKARDTRLDRTVAIKVSNEKFSERFDREARAVAALNHPYICTLHDVGPNYLVMEYIEGAPLKGPLPLDQALKYAAQICEALDAAHKKGIAHRDLKPANILVTKQGIKLLDFGLARIAACGDETVTMAVMGTPAYMAPEQWDGKPGDARSDIYALGCVLYELLTGKRVSPDREAVKPAAIEHVIGKCLEEDPDERWQSARDIRGILKQPLAAAAPLSLRNPWRERAAWIAVAVVLAGVSVFLAMRASRPPGAGDLVSFAVYPPEKTIFSATDNTTVNVPQFALSPDGRTLAFVAAKADEKPLLWLRPIAEVAAHSLPGTEDAGNPFWSPDSRWVGFFADGKLKKIPASGGGAQVVAETNSDFRGGAWGLDDGILFASGIKPIGRVPPAGGAVSPVTVMEAPQEHTHRYPMFLPGGNRFLYTVEGAPERNGVYAGALGTKIKKRLLALDCSAIYAPPGYLLYVDGDALMGQAFDAGSLEVSGQPFLVAAHAGRSSAVYSAISASPTGTLAYAGTIAQIGRLLWFDRRGNALGQAAPEGDYTDFRVSPNEKSVAVSSVDRRTGNVDIWIADLERKSLYRFTAGGRLSNMAAWSPDGTRLVFRTLRNGLIELYHQSAGGGGHVTPVGLVAAQSSPSGIEGQNLNPTDWSPDGKYILFSVPGSATGSDLWLAPLASDGKPVKYLIADADQIHGNFSPDGRLVAYTSNESGKYEVYVRPFPLSENKWLVSINGGYEPRWRADGREMYYLSEDRKLMSVPVSAGPAFGVPETLFQTRVPSGVHANRTHYVPSRDGKRFLVNTEIGDPSLTPITVVVNWTAALKK